MRSVESILRSTIDVKEKILADPELLEAVARAGHVLMASYRAGGRSFFCGNGGSAADAQHFAAELSGRFLLDRPPLAAEVLHGNTSHLTAVANDDDYASVFARALQGTARTGDVLVALSTSGSSPSIVRAAETARAAGVHVVALTGADGGELAGLADVELRVPSDDTGRVQESHVVFLHAISEQVEFGLFGRA
jgi:D-sedoheptulose 7-phosphate isomerase